MIKLAGKIILDFMLSLLDGKVPQILGFLVHQRNNLEKLGPRNAGRSYCHSITFYPASIQQIWTRSSG